MICSIRTWLAPEWRPLLAGAEARKVCEVAGERILVVEDERAVARGLARMLKRLGEETLTIAFLDDADLMDPDSARLLPRQPF
mgnify:CR=1 FL=1